jgi:hypothetical protein
VQTLGRCSRWRSFPLRLAGDSTAPPWARENPQTTRGLHCLRKPDSLKPDLLQESGFRKETETRRKIGQKPLPAGKVPNGVRWKNLLRLLSSPPPAGNSR